MNEKIRYFFPKLKNRFNAEKNRILEFLPIERFALLGLDCCDGKDGFLKRLHNVLGDEVCNNVIPKADTENIIIAADKAYNHIFDLLGSGEIIMNHIEWSKELKTNFKWPKDVYYTKQRALTPKGSDIKLPWELSRCHHLLWLGEAFLFTGEEKYAQEVVNEINDWIDENKLMYTVNWTCAMDVAIRAINWMYALHFIEHSCAFDDSFADKVYKSLYQHMFFIDNNLEKNIPYSNNHYVSDIVGLLFLGAFFSTNHKGRQFLKYAKREYIKEVLVEVLPSGINYEKSVSYHRLMTELLVYSRNMLVRIGENLPINVEERLTKMLDYVGQYSVNKLSPLVGDNDNGRLLPFMPRGFKDHSYLINNESIEWRVMNNGITPLKVSHQYFGNMAFTDANVAILKDGEQCVFVGCCSRWKHDKVKKSYSGTHLHNDLLSFVYFDNGREIIVDPGTYCYTSNLKLRNDFRSTKKHNTIIVDEEEQNLLDVSTAFGMIYNSKAKPLMIREHIHPNCQGEYKTIRGGMRHQRTFLLNENGFEIKDMINKHGNGHDLCMFFHFAKDVEVTLDGTRVMLKVNDLQYRIYFNSSTRFTLSLENDTIAPSYGIIENTKTLVFKSSFAENISIKTLISKECTDN